MAETCDTEKLIKLRFDYFTTEGFEMTAESAALIKAQLESYYPEHINRDFFAALAEDDKGNVLSSAFLVIFEKPANSRSFPTGKTGLLLNVLTYPEHRRKGFAKRILERLIEEAKRHNLSYIELSSSEMGKALYEKLGFREPDPSHFTGMKLNLLEENRL
jgi:GNAT superfamily N-acetyltransferase